MERCLLPRHATQPQSPRIFVLHGLGGIGKTKLAAAFARQHQREFSAVFWLDGRSEDQLKQSLSSCARRIPQGQIPDKSRDVIPKSEDELNIVVRDVLGWLSQSENRSWLLIFDNVDLDNEQGGLTSKYDIQQYLPGSNGSVLITSRLERLAQLGESREVKRGNADLSKAIFQEWYGAEFIWDEAGQKLLELLDGLPLALAQVASYLRETKCNTAWYLQQYTQKWDEMMAEDDDSDTPLADYAGRSVATTWAISLQAIESKSKAAANLIRLWAFLHHKDLWHGLLQGGQQGNGHGARGEWLDEMARSEIQFLKAMRLLRRYSMIEIDMDEHGGLEVHPVVHIWMSHVQSQSEKEEFLRLAVLVVGQALPKEGVQGYWLTCQRLLPHAESCLKLLGKIGVNEIDLDDNMANLAMHEIGKLYFLLGRRAEAKAILQQVLEVWEKALGLEHFLTLGVVTNLGSVYGQLGEPAKAESMHKQALEGYEKTVGVESIAALHTVSNLATNLMVEHGRLIEAEALYKQALEGQEKVDGPKNVSTLMTASNLGALYLKQRRLPEAEPMLKRAYEGFKKILGPEHTSTLSVTYNLGVLYHNQELLREAEAMCDQALAGYKNTLDLKHPSTLEVIHTLGIIYKDQRRLPEAEKQFKQALEGFEKVMGLKYTSKLGIIVSLGSLFESQGRLADAEQMYKRALNGCIDTFGPTHEKTKLVQQMLQSLSSIQH